MDNATLLGIALSVLSILISIALTIAGFFFASKNDKTMADIHAQLEAQNKTLLVLLQDTLKSINMQNGTNVVKEGEVHSGEWSKEKEEQRQRYEALQMMRQTLSYPAPVLSKEKKIGERKEHG